MSIAQRSKLLIRTDGGHDIGSGHIMRCLALAQAWQDAGGEVYFAMVDPPPALRDRLEKEGVGIFPINAEPGTLADAACAIRLARQVGAQWMVVDGYHFGSRYQQAVRDGGLFLLFLDDYGHAGTYSADIVLNQNIYAREEMYARREAHTRLLLGTRYALLRREFWPWRDWRREIPAVARNILVTMGGADPTNVTLIVVQALEPLCKAHDLKVRAVIGASNSHVSSVAQSVVGDESITLVRNVVDMAELMAWADVAISAAGSTVYELAFMQTPSLITILADNQIPIADGSAGVGMAANLGWYNQLTPDRFQKSIQWICSSRPARLEMSAAGHCVVDGDGAKRTAEIIWKAYSRGEA